MVTQGGQCVTENSNQKSHQCNFCGKSDVKFQCNDCKAVKYCNSDCQKKHWPNHRALCTAIAELSKFENSSRPPPDAAHFSTHLTPKQHEKIVGFVGNRCSINCQLNGKMVEALWDTGSQVSICSETFLRENFRETEIRDISDLISANLNLTAANDSAIPYQGWVELEFQVDPEAETLAVPFLIAKESLDLPLIGYNIIEHYINLDSKYATADSLNATFPKADHNEAFPF